jgi:hypothetical protein
MAYAINKIHPRRHTMPRRDGTGPMGFGSLSGRGMGFCARQNGYGMGRGWRSGAAAVQPSVGHETLTMRKRILEEELKQVESLLAQEHQK